MTYFQSIILGLVEGVTEYLPISSTFHLIWTSKLLGVAQTDFQKAYEVIIQGGAILAVLLLYLNTFLTNRKLLLKIFYSFVPTAILGFLLYKIIKGSFFENYQLQLAIFAFVGLFFMFDEAFVSKLNLKKNLADLSTRDALIIGFIQVLAVFPGVSRAGAVIVGMMVLRVKRDEAAKYSFLLAVPTLLAASALDLYVSLPTLVSHPENMGFLIVGFITSFISALFVVKWLINFLQKHTLVAFGIYRLILASSLFLLFFKQGGEFL